MWAGKPKPTTITIRTSAGKVTVDNRKGVDDSTIRAASLRFSPRLNPGLRAVVKRCKAVNGDGSWIYDPRERV